MRFPRRARYEPLRPDDDLDPILEIRRPASIQEIYGATDRETLGEQSPEAESPQSDTPRDVAAQLLVSLGRSPTERILMSSADNSRVLRRIDLALLPLMLVVYFLHALDKATLSYASVFGLIEDANLHGNQFSWLGSVVFLAQLIFQFPVACALTRWPMHGFLSCMVLGWGVTLAWMSSSDNFGILLIQRFILGGFEASVGPAFIAITQMWWRRREQTMRVGWWYCMNGLTWVVSTSFCLEQGRRLTYSGRQFDHLWSCQPKDKLEAVSDHLSLIWSRHGGCLVARVPLDAGLAH